MSAIFSEGWNAAGCWETVWQYWDSTYYPSTNVYLITVSTYGEPEVSDCPEDPPPAEICYDDCTGEEIPCEGANPFQATDGNVTRDILDLKLPSATEGRLDWIRHHNTVPRDGVGYFGRGGNWRHSWQYDLKARTPAGPIPQMVLVYPNGQQRFFSRAANGTWSSAERFQEKMSVTAYGFEVTTPEGQKLKFVRSADAKAPHLYEMQAFTNSFGVVTTLDYGSNGLLRRVTQPSGRWLAFEYSGTPFKKGIRHRLGAITQAPAPGQWLELTVPADKNQQAFRHLRLSGPADSAPIAVAELQFIAASGAILRGKVHGTGSQPAALTDGNPATFFMGNRTSLNLCGVDLGESGKSAVAKIRILAARGQEQALVGAVFDGMELAPSSSVAISRVTSSTGLAVNYDYALMAEPTTQNEYLTLKTVSYGDGTRASYRYDWSRADSRPLLVETDDPRYEGRAKRIRYAYHDKLGMIHQEINPATGSVYASLELDPLDSRARTVRYSDLREIKYRLAADRPVIEERTDSLGRKTRIERDAVGRIKAVVNRNGRRDERAYDDRGHTKSSQRNGRMELQRERDPQGRIVRDTDRLGRETRYERDGKGRVTRMTRGSGEIREFGRDAQNRITSTRSSRGGLHQFTYNDRGLKATWTDPSGNVSRFAYDANERLSSMTDSLGRISRYEHNERGLTTKVTAPDGTSKQFAYDTYGRKIAETDPQGHTTKLTYDELSRVIRQEDHAGRVTTFDYTEIPQGCGSCTLVPHPTRIVAPDGTIMAMLYDTEGHMLSRTVAQGTPAQATTLYAYDNDGNMTSMTDPLGRVTRFTYDDEHHRLTQTDALGRLTQWTYDDDGNVTKTVAPDGGITKSTYDEGKRMTATTDAAGNTTRYTYDANGRIATLTEAKGDITRFRYDEGGRKIATIYTDGKKALIDYDNAGRAAKITSSDGLVTVTTYDAGNSPLAVTRTAPGKSAETTAFTYDALGHRLTATDPLGRKTTWTYDAHGNVLTMTRPDGIVGTRNTYDVQDNLLTVTDAAGAVTTYTYDAARNQTSLTDARGSRYAFTHDALRRKTSMTYPDGSVEKWTYDLSGNPVAFVNRAGQIKATAYTVANQPVTEVWSAAPSPLAPSLTPTLPAATSYAYNSDGRLREVDNGNAKLTYTYDELGRLASETSDLSALVPGLDPHTVGYRYDVLGRRSDLVYPDKTKVSYDYDARSRLTTIDTKGSSPQSSRLSPLASYAYDAQGRIAQLTRDNGVASTYTYDMAGQLTDITHASGSSVLARSAYTFDVLGRRTSQTREDGITETYGYDTTSQLTSADYGVNSPLAKAPDPVTRETFAYDALGNRTSTSAVGGVPSPRVSTYTANALNQYTQVAGASLTYDANGNLTNDGKQTYRYDAQNRLLAVEPIAPAPGAVRAEFAYDARNRAVARTYHTLSKAGAWVLNPDDSLALTYDVAWNLLAECMRNGTQVGKYIHGQRTDEILVSSLKSQTLYPLADALGSVVTLASDDGKVSTRFRYGAYGRPVTLSASYQSGVSGVLNYRFLFTGREWLGAVGLNDNRNRIYTQWLGKWLTIDPILFASKHINLYSYVGNEPIGGVDPLGTICINTIYTKPCDSISRSECAITCNSQPRPRDVGLCFEVGVVGISIFGVGGIGIIVCICGDLITD
ncbi:MAG: RHS repeat protein [Undibacterium sp.]|nr:RHS repeat protein [Opitutaceae bacterium]